MKKGKVLLTKRILAFGVAFLMVVSSMSLPVFASETDVTDEAVVTTEDKQVTVEQKEDAQETVKPEEHESQVKPEEEKKQEEKKDTVLSQEKNADDSKKTEGRKSTKASVDAIRNITVSRSGATITVKGTIKNSDYIFAGIAVDEDIYYVDSSEYTSFTYSKKCSPGYHSVVVGVYSKASGKVDEAVSFIKTDIAVPMTDKPTYKGVFNVYAKSLTIYPYNMAGANQSYRLYLEYRKAGTKTWKRSGYMTANAVKLYIDQGFKIKGFKANKKYATRLRYGISATKSDGSTGLILGPVLNTGTIKTGQAKKPKVKSVTVKAVKVKYHKHRVAGHYYWTGYQYVWIGPYTEKYYTCKIKVTVKLKKKPGAKGLWINGKFVKGNKKKYTAKFTPYPNYYTKKPPKGMKYKVKIRSYQNKKYYGFSPIYKKKKKVK